MSDDMNEKILDYIVGGLPKGQAEALEKQAEGDRELQAKIAVLRVLMGSDASPVSSDQTRSEAPAFPHQSPTRMAGVPFRKIAASLVLLGTLTGMGYAGWAYLTAPLLKDDFHTGWFDSQKWLPPPETIKEGGVRLEEGYIRLVNRGYLVTRKEYKEPLSIRLKWKWVQLGLNPMYADHLAVALRTSGIPTPTGAHEVQDGILVRFNAWAGMVEVFWPGQISKRGQTPAGSVSMPADKFHDIKITDDGENIIVYFGTMDNPVLRVPCKGSFPQHHLGLYNREFVSFPHESLITDIEVRSMKR